jgi:hypothetical protein
MKILSHIEVNISNGSRQGKFIITSFNELVEEINHTNTLLYKFIIPQLTSIVS